MISAARQRLAHGTREQRADRGLAAAGRVDRGELGVGAEAAAGQVKLIQHGPHALDRVVELLGPHADHVDAGAEGTPALGRQRSHEPPDVVAGAELLAAGAEAAGWTLWEALDWSLLVVEEELDELLCVVELLTAALFALLWPGNERAAATATAPVNVSEPSRATRVIVPIRRSPTSRSRTPRVA